MDLPVCVSDALPQYAVASSFVPPAPAANSSHTEHAFLGTEREREREREREARCTYVRPSVREQAARVPGEPSTVGEHELTARCTRGGERVVCDSGAGTVGLVIYELSRVATECGCTEHNLVISREREREREPYRSTRLPLLRNKTVDQWSCEPPRYGSEARRTDARGFSRRATTTRPVGRTPLAFSASTSKAATAAATTTTTLGMSDDSRRRRYVADAGEFGHGVETSDNNPLKGWEKQKLVSLTKAISKVESIVPLAPKYALRSLQFAENYKEEHPSVSHQLRTCATVRMHIAAEDTPCFCTPPNNWSRATRAYEIEGHLCL